MTTTLVVAGECVLLAAAAFVVAEVLTTVWYERVYLPRIAGEE